jgi:hypothetical protein
MRSTPLALCLLALTSCIAPEPGDLPDDDPTADGATGTVRARYRDGTTAELPYTVRAGRAIHQGDMDLGAIEDILELRGGAVTLGALWTNGIVNYAYDPGFGSDDPTACDGTTTDIQCVCRPNPAVLGAEICEDPREVFEAVVAELDALLPVTFNRVSPGYSGDYILVQYMWDPGGNWAGSSQVGMTGDEQRFNFRLDDFLLPPDEPTFRTARHEMIHALGLYHEQSRFLRDLYVEVTLSCVPVDVQGNFDVSLGPIIGPYDFLSIMHYEADAFCTDGFDPDDECDCTPLVKRDPVPGVPDDEFALGSVELSGEDINTLSEIYAKSGGTNDTRDRYGTAMVIADFNGDGYDDLAIGAPNEDLTTDDEGMVYVYRGTSRGLVFWQQISHATCAATPVGGEKFGAALVAGRFDEDELLDLAIGAPSEMVGGVRAGAVFVLRGTPRGLEPLRTITETSPTMFTAQASDQFGAALAAADLIQAARDALIIGAPGDRDPSGATTTGAVYAYYFSKDGLGISPGTRVGGTTGSRLGSAFAVGRMDAGLRFDVAVGAPGFQINTGRVVFMTGQNVSTGTPLATWVGLLAEKTTLDGTASGTRFGETVAFGNIGALDPLVMDLVVGSPSFSSARGRVQVFDLFSDFTTAPPINILHSGALPGSRLGAALAIGNIDNSAGTPLPDLVIGEPGSNGSRGSIAIVRGNTLALSHVGQSGLGDDTAGDEFGASLAIGNLDGWGLTIDDVDDKRTGTGFRRLDLMVGTPGEEVDLPLGLTDPTAGAAYLFDGQATGLPSFRAIYHQEVAE